MSISNNLNDFKDFDPEALKYVGEDVAYREQQNNVNSYNLDEEYLEKQHQQFKTWELVKKLQDENTCTNDQYDAFNGIVDYDYEPFKYDGFDDGWNGNNDKKECEYRQKKQKRKQKQIQQHKALPPVRQHQPVHGSKDEVMTLYHVTSAESAAKIKASNKLIRGSNGMFGGGIYFAEKAEDANYKAEHRGFLVTCRVYVGKQLRVEDCNGGKFTFTSLYKEGYDSVWAPFGAGKGKPERVVYNWDQVVIVSVEEYKQPSVKNMWQKYNV